LRHQQRTSTRCANGGEAPRPLRLPKLVSVRLEPRLGVNADCRPAVKLTLRRAGARTLANPPADLSQQAPRGFVSFSLFIRVLSA
jgi:hypothetical protein